MNTLRHIEMYLVVCVAALLLNPVPATWQAGQSALTPPELRDGQHDFDFNFGTWKTHISRLQHPLTGSKSWTTMDGDVYVRKVWDGRAQLEEIEADGANGHFEGLTLFLYNPEAHQWGLSFANSNDGVISQPSVGEFKNGLGEFYSQDNVGGRAILVRQVWSSIAEDSHRFEQSFSDDGGKTWETNFIAELKREKDVAGVRMRNTAAPVADANVPHDFDSALGTWKEQTMRLVHPLTGSTTWIEMSGVSVVRNIWNGRGNITELESDGPNGHLELLALRLYNPQTKQWSLTFATSDVGVLGMPPTIGDFKNGRGEFYDQETYKGRTILLRFTFVSLSPVTARSEQAFSADGGKSWETNWINNYTRIPDVPTGTGAPSSGY
jgi:hypothetical protein